jgi:hypothetical protein
VVQVVQENRDLALFEIRQQIDDSVDGRTRPMMAFGMHCVEMAVTSSRKTRKTTGWADALRNNTQVSVLLWLSCKERTARKEQVVGGWRGKRGLRFGVGQRNEDVRAESDAVAATPTADCGVLHR